MEEEIQEKKGKKDDECPCAEAISDLESEVDY
jgi:hypothetical protein